MYHIQWFQPICICVFVLVYAQPCIFYCGISKVEHELFYAICNIHIATHALQILILFVLHNVSSTVIL
jgi:hypothetical protein